MPFIGTDFSNDAACIEVIAAIAAPCEDRFLPYLQIIDEPYFCGIEASQLGALAVDPGHAAILAADKITMNDPERHVLCIDLLGLGRWFRLVPAELWSVEKNLSLANIDFDEFADDVNDDGVFRGF